MPIAPIPHKPIEPVQKPKNWWLERIHELSQNMHSLHQNHTLNEEIIRIATACNKIISQTYRGYEARRSTFSLLLNNVKISFYENMIQILKQYSQLQTKDINGDNWQLHLCLNIIRELSQVIAPIPAYLSDKILGDNIPVQVTHTHQYLQSITPYPRSWYTNSYFLCCQHTSEYHIANNGALLIYLPIQAYYNIRHRDSAWLNIETFEVCCLNGDVIGKIVDRNVPLSKYGFINCGDCGRVIDFNSAYITEYDGESDAHFICNMCHQEYTNRAERNLVAQYDFHKNLPIHKIHKELLFFGTEVEVCNVQNKVPRHELAKKLLKTFGNNLLYCKHDGSIQPPHVTEPHTSGEYGLEVVFAPLSELYLKQEQKSINMALTIMRNMGYLAESVPSCGFHVHINREALSKVEVFKLIRLFKLCPLFIQAISDRLSKDFMRRYASLTPEYFYSDADLTFNHYDRCSCPRYVALNLTNKATIEARIFQGVDTIEQYMIKIGRINSLINFVRNYGVFDIQPDKLHRYIEKQICEKYLGHGPLWRGIHLDYLRVDKRNFGIHSKVLTSYNHRPANETSFVSRALRDLTKRDEYVDIFMDLNNSTIEASDNTLENDLYILRGEDTIYTYHRRTGYTLSNSDFFNATTGEIPLSVRNHLLER